jgi:hypothetical protein
LVTALWGYVEKTESGKKLQKFPNFWKWQIPINYAEWWLEDVYSELLLRVINPSDYLKEQVNVLVIWFDGQPSMANKKKELEKKEKRGMEIFITKKKLWN